MKLQLLILCSFSALFIQAQQGFRIAGKISTISGSKQMILQTNAGEIRSEIQTDGSFSLTGEANEPGIAFIKTDSSAPDIIWIEPGTYSLECKEINYPGIKRVLFRTPSLNGPQDAMIQHGYSQSLYSIRADSIQTTKEKYRDFALKYLDSTIRKFPHSKALPEILRSAQNYIGDEATAAFQSMLDTDQRTDGNSKQLDNYFARKKKIEAEKYFEDFSITDSSGNVFQLSSLKNKKLILIDFWSSDCYPCRAKHPRLVALYEKYASKGLGIVSVSLDEERDAWVKAIQKDKLTWTNVSDLKGWDAPVALHYFITSIPFAFWLDGDRKIISTKDLSDEEIVKLLQ